MSKLYIMQAVSSSNGQLYSWNANTPDFAATGFPGPGSPLNVALVDSHSRSILINKPDTRYNPVGLYNFEGNLNDSSGNGRNLSLAQGTIKYTQIYPGLNGFWFDGATRLTNASSAFQIAGDITVMILVWINDYTTNSMNYVICNGNGDILSTNYLYAMFTDNVSGYLDFFWEHGAGINDGYILDTAPNSYSLPRKALTHYAISRQSNVIRFYINGKQVGADSPVQIAPDGGTASNLAIGMANPTVTNNAPCTNVWIGSVKIVASALSASQIAAEYNYIMGKRFPNV